MSRACETCEWSRENPRPTGPVHAGYLLCKEGPIEALKAPADWCSRWKPAERLIGGVDARKRA